MKILLTGTKIFPGLPMSFFRAFKSLGLDVEIFDDHEYYWKQFPFIKNRYTHRLFWKPFSLFVNRELIRIVNERKPDLLFIIKGWFYNPATFRKIKKYNPGMKLFCFNQENPFNFRIISYSNNWVFKSIPLFDAYFTWGKFLMEPIKKAGARRVEYLPFARDPYLSYPIEVKDEDKKVFGSDISFIGTWSRDREYWLSHLIDYDFSIWGKFWERADKRLRAKWKGRDAAGENFAKICNCSKIMIDILRPQMIPSHSMKTFEIPASGGFLMCNRPGEIHNFLKEGEEIVIFADPKDMVEKIDFYLKEEELRRKIAEAGYKKLQNPGYSYTDRARKVVEVYQTFNEK